MKKFLLYVFCITYVLAFSVSAQAKEWDDGGTLHDDTVMAWAISSHENILASSADYIKGCTDPTLLNNLQDNELRAAADKVAVCMQKFTDRAVSPVTRENATPYVMDCIKQAKSSHSWMLTKDLDLTVKLETPVEAPPTWDIAKAKPLPYAVIDFNTDHRAAIGRTKASARMVLATHDAQGKVNEVPESSQFTKEQLAATVISAAKYMAKESKVDFVGVVLLSQFDAGYATTQLAVADYAPDGRGVSGRDNWKWQMVQATEIGLTKQELAMQNLWGKLRDQYQTPSGTDEPALIAAISKKLGIPEDQVNTAYKPLLKVPMEFMDAVPPTPSLRPKKVKK